MLLAATTYGLSGSASGATGDGILVMLMADPLALTLMHVRQVMVA